MLAASTPDGSKPRSTRFSATRLLTMRPAPTRSASDSATSATSRMFRPRASTGSRRHVRCHEAPRSAACATPARPAGSRSHARAYRQERGKRQDPEVESRRIGVDQSGRRKRNQESRVHQAIRRPAAAPRVASTTLCVMRLRMRRLRDAPSVARIATSRRCASERTITRPATLAHAMRRTRPTAASSKSICGADFAHLVGAQRRQGHALLGGLWKLTADRMEMPKLGGRRFRRDAARQPGDDVHAMIQPVAQHVIVRAEDERPKEVDGRGDFRVNRRHELGWHHANHFMIGAVQLDATSHGSGIATEQPSPGRVSQDGDAVASPVEVGGREGASGGGSQTQDVEGSEADVPDVRRSGVEAGEASSRLVQTPSWRRRSGRAPGSRRVSPAARSRASASGGGVRRDSLPDRHQAVRFGVGQGPENHGVDETEDGGIGANPQREREDHGECEARRPAEQPDCVKRVPQQIIKRPKPRASRTRSRVCPHRRDRAVRAGGPRPAPGLDARSQRCEAPGRCRFLRHVAFRALAPEPLTQPRTETAKRRHHGFTLAAGNRNRDMMADARVHRFSSATSCRRPSRVRL